MSDQLAESLGPCPECGAELALDQRYCVDCGRRLGPALSLPYPIVPRTVRRARSAALPMPLRLVTTLALTAVGFGVVVGTAMSTVLSEPTSMPPPLVAQTPREAPPPEAPAEPVAPPPSVPPTPTPPPSLGTGSSLIPPSSAPTTVKPVKPKPQMIGGTVVQVNRVAGTYAVAQSAGPLVAIHAKKLPEQGAKVRTPVRTLLNGTYAEEGKRKTRGRGGKATFSGTVTFRDDEPGKGFYTVSSAGTSVLVRMTPDAAGVATPPPFGSAVTVNVRLDPFTPPTATAPGTGTTTTPAPARAPAPKGCDSDGEAASPTPKVDPSLVLTQTSLKVDQQTVTDGDVAGTVQAVCPGAGELVLSADGTRESGRDIVIGVPASSGVDLSKVPLGIAVIGGVELKQPSSLSLHGIASDQGFKGADNQKQLQGTL